MLLKDVRVESPHRHRLLTLFPLVDPAGRSLPCRLLSEALEEGTLRIEEVSEEGSVPELLARNEGHRDVLVLDGQQLVGAKQNRMTGRSLLLPAKTDTRIPVSCMERGRWHRRSRGFREAPDHAPPEVRRRVREAEARSVGSNPRREGEARRRGTDPRRGTAARDGEREARGGRPRTAQSAVWSSIDELSARSGVRSDTGALDHLFDGRRDELEAGVRGFPRLAGQVGVVAAVGDRVVGMDLLGAAGLHARLHRRLIRGYLFEALAAEKRDGSGDDGAGERAWPGRDAALKFLILVAQARRDEVDPVGRGTYRVLSGTALGGELRDDARDDARDGSRSGARPAGRGGRLAHLSAFPGEVA